MKNISVGKTKVFNWIAAGALLIIMVGIGRILTWSLASANVLEINNSPFPVRTIREHPSADGVVILQVNFCKNIDIEGNLRISFVSESREVFLPLSVERSAKECRETEVPVLLPKGLPPDIYKVKFRVTYNINPIKKGIVEEFESQKFEVVP